MPWRTVRGNVELLAELHGFAAGGAAPDWPAGHRPRRSHRVRGALPEVAVGWDADALLAGRTLTLQPPVMLFDEPFGAVDEITRERLNEETLRLFEDQRFAGLFITHSISEAVFLSTGSS